MDVEFLRTAYQRTKKTGSPGIAGVTVSEYADDLDAHLKDLHERLRSGRYKASPVERVWLEKPDGGQRPIGKPAFEDKIVQRAVVMLLEQIYENDFYEFSYGFRPSRSPHQALRELRSQCQRMNVHWIIDADVSGFFDAIEHHHLRTFLRRRMNDGSLMRLIGKWLNAGVLEEGKYLTTDIGSPQGGVISPLAANVYLHYVLDEWFVTAVQPRMTGRVFLIRFADDFIIGCECKTDATRIMEVLPKRFARYGLTIHPTKSHMVAFGRPSRDSDPRQSPLSGKGTFDFVGFTHYWGRTRSGGWTIKRRTAKKRIRRTCRAIWQWCRKNRHQPVPEQHRTLTAKLRGHFQYYGVRCNIQQLLAVKESARRAWFYWLNRRRRHRDYNWDEFTEFLEKFPLPRASIVHHDV
jgi:group II intron reverse transcriptase/maturase